MKLKKLKINLGARSYPVIIGKSASEILGPFLSKRRSKKVFVLSDERLVQARRALVRSLKSQGLIVHDIPLKAGERLKDIHSVYAIYGELLKAKADRDSVIVALGGGSVGDVAGFVAATYMRGIDWVGLPTTLLAQVDSSVGGKTGMNHTTGKNLIGAFHQPILVICDTSFLKTLGPREMVSGMGEIVKCALTFDPKFFNYLVKNIDHLMSSDPSVLQYCIQKSLEWKSKAVAKDEFDRTGVREVLNFGHTFGHALETETDYKKYQHGEAVILGMRFALALSERRGVLSILEREKMDALLCRFPIAPIPATIKMNQIFSHMKKDKKSENGSIRFVLLDRLGHSVSDRGVTTQDLVEAFLMLFQPDSKPAKGGNYGK